MNSAGAVVASRRDYLPFGEDVPASVGMRAQTPGYSEADGARRKYAGMERDDSTGMSHTLWREYDPLPARWTAPDPYSGSMSPADPQSFNRYAYCDNDPVNHTDPTGLMLSDIGVMQTSDPEYARTLQAANDASWMNGINEDYAAQNNWILDEVQGGGTIRRPRSNRPATRIRQNLPRTQRLPLSRRLRRNQNKLEIRPDTVAWHTTDTGR
ncbi:MAG TPA: RHS repeat-associated core domain-containing protein [Pyrinomonadaceae bacterium]|jgi:RHS repeat-associated protein|nr:RHS repeat-associated core domain-containing protein [Pyrinomonadaceae bacterium]